MQTFGSSGKLQAASAKKKLLGIFLTRCTALAANLNC
jgi:hypothetical protein